MALQVRHQGLQVLVDSRIPEQCAGGPLAVLQRGQEAVGALSDLLERLAGFLVPREGLSGSPGVVRAEGRGERRSSVRCLLYPAGERRDVSSELGAQGRQIGEDSPP
jgi:hypothetical protein